VNTLASEPPSAISLLLCISDQQKGMVNIATQVGPHIPDTSICNWSFSCCFALINFQEQPFLKGNYDLSSGHVAMSLLIPSHLNYNAEAMQKCCTRMCSIIIHGSGMS